MNAIEFSTGLDLAPMKRDFAQAEAIGKVGVAKVQNAMKNAAAVNRNYPGAGMFEAQQRRAQQAADRFWDNYVDPATAARRRRNSAAGFKPAPPGKYPAPMDEEAKGNKSILLQARAVTTAYAIARLADIYRQAGLEAYKLGVQTDNLTRHQSAFAGAGAYEERLSEIAEARDAAYERERSDKQSVFSKIMAGFRIQMNQLHGYGTPAEQGAQQARDKAAMTERASEALAFMADRQEMLNEAERESMSGSERKSALLKAEVQNREKLATLARMEAAAGAHNPAAMNAENERYRNELALINRRAAAARQIVAIEAANLYRTRTGSGVTPDAARAENLRERMKEIAREMVDASDERRSQLSNERISAQSELDAMLLDSSRQDPSERNTARQRALRDARDLKRLKDNKGLTNVRRGMDGRVIGGIDPISGEYRAADSESGGNRMAWELSKHMPGPSHMTAYGGSADFNKVFGGPDNKMGTQAAHGADGAQGTQSGVTKEDINTLVGAINNPEWAK